MKKIAYTKAAAKTLATMPANESARVKSKIEQYANDPDSLANNITKLQGREGVRLRVGNWRVIMSDSGAVLAILNIGPRGSIYD